MATPSTLVMLISSVSEIILVGARGEHECDLCSNNNNSTWCGMHW